MSDKIHQQYPNFDLKYAKPIRKAWAAALRSGKYTPGTSCLKDAKGNCCPAGVLCEAFYEMYPGRVKRDKDAQGRTTYDGEAFIVPQKIAELVGLTDRDCRFRDRSGKFAKFADKDTQPGWVSLANANDAGLISYEDAAKVVEDRSSHIFVES